jgi:hypothetical protein
VRGVIAHQVDWIEGHRDHARFVYMRGTLDWETPAAAQLEELNRNVAAAFREWMAPLVESGRIRPMSMVVVNAIVTGPVHAIARRWLAGQVDTRLRSYVDELADAACSALTGKPVSASKRRASPIAQHGRMRLELVAEDGQVVAEGDATADLRPVQPEVAA